MPHTILLVDDDADSRTLVREGIAFACSGAEVREVSSGPEALEYLRRQGRFAEAPRPSVIFMDIEMPGMSGQELLKILKADPELKEIPVVMLTGLDDEQQKRQAARNGANSYTVKPPQVLAMLESVRATTDYWLHCHRCLGA